MAGSRESWSLLRHNNKPWREDKNTRECGGGGVSGINGGISLDERSRDVDTGNVDWTVMDEWATWTWKGKY